MEIFKGIALFTPGGDVFYCIDPSKQNRWHLHLCAALQETLGLEESPHFLVPGYTATVDRHTLNHRGEVKTIAELYPAVRRYQPLLNSLFNLEKVSWQVVSWQEKYCSPIILATYRQQFPQLWQNHDLIVPVMMETTPSTHLVKPESSYLLRLFISGNNPKSTEILSTVHRLLEDGLNHPYNLKVVDIVKHPDQAEQYQIAATPTLLRMSPQPLRRIVGEFNNWSRVLKILTT